MSVVVVMWLFRPDPDGSWHRVVVFESKDAPASERRRAELGKFLRTRRGGHQLVHLAGAGPGDLSSEFAELWSRHEVAEFQPRIRTYIHPQAGELTFTMSELQVPASQEARLIVCTPADDETRKWLPLTRDEFAAGPD